MTPLAGNPIRSTRLRPLITAVLVAVLAPMSAWAHGLVFTRVEAVITGPTEVEITLDYNLALVLPSPAAYHALTRDSTDHQRETVQRVLPQILGAMEFYAGDARLALQLASFALPELPAAAFEDPAQDKSATLVFTAPLPAVPAPLQLVVAQDAPVEPPVMFAVSTRANGLLMRSWVEEGPSELLDFDWRTLPAAGAADAPAAGTASPLAARPTWPVELWTYLQLGFKHIVPQGLDHVLFVLALFFLGQTWRKLVAQTTVFTIAHATTLLLSRYGVVAVPTRVVEPLIAFSIACIALENLWSPKLGPARLALVFAFGLVHGLGFAGSLAEVKFPQEEFLVALLGFNLGVDVGQLLVITLALLAVGWWRDRPWFHPRVTVPGCLAIAAIGLGWTIQRIFF